MKTNNMHKYVRALLLVAIASGVAYGCSSDDGGGVIAADAGKKDSGKKDAKTPTEDPGDDDAGEEEEEDTAPPKKDSSVIQDSSLGTPDSSSDAPIPTVDSGKSDAAPGADAGVCSPKPTTGFVPATTKTITPKANKCTSAQLDSFVKCMKDLTANKSDCLAYGFDPTKTLGTAFTTPCADCLFNLPGEDGTATTVFPYNGSFVLDYNEVACLDAFGGANCGKNLQGYDDCTAAACDNTGCQFYNELYACYDKAGDGSCKAYGDTALACVDGTTAGKTTSVPLKTGATTNPVMDICSKIGRFGFPTDSVAYGYGKYFCGN